MLYKFHLFGHYITQQKLFTSHLEAPDAGEAVKQRGRIIMRAPEVEEQLVFMTTAS